MMKDHTGKVYKSMIEMCKAWDMPYELVYQRKVIAKWPLVEALTTPVEEGVGIYDHDGNEYSSFAEMCAAYHRASATYLGRRNRGWTREEALTTEPVLPGTKERNQEAIMSLFDQLAGLTAEDLLKAVKLYQEVNDQERDVYAAPMEHRPRKKSGPQPKTLVDRDGNVFHGLREACQAYGRSYELAKHRLFDNWPLQYALEMPPGCEAFYDHVGNEFRTLAQMCRYYEIDRAVFAKRYDAGWTLEDALMLPVGKTPKRLAGEKEESL